MEQVLPAREPEQVGVAAIAARVKARGKVWDAVGVWDAARAKDKEKARVKVKVRGKSPAMQTFLPRNKPEQKMKHGLPRFPLRGPVLGKGGCVCIVAGM